LADAERERQRCRKKKFHRNFRCFRRYAAGSPAMRHTLRTEALAAAPTTHKVPGEFHNENGRPFAGRPLRLSPSSEIEAALSPSG
jgi:hypothetical protein